MSKYTTEVRYILEEWCRINHPNDPIPTGVGKKEEYFCNTAANDWDFEFPIWDGETCAGLLSVILRHFYFREIGFETAGLWKYMLLRRLQEIMPYFVSLYSTTIQQFSMINNVDVTESFTKENSESGNSTTTQNISDEGNNSSTVTANETLITSDLPQTTLTLQDANRDYATGSSQSTDKSQTENYNNQTSSSHMNNEMSRSGNETYTRTRKGIDGGKSPTELIMEYRQSIISIYNLIMEKCEDLFMLIY